MKTILLLMVIGVFGATFVNRAVWADDDVNASAMSGFEYHLALELLPLTESVNDPAGTGLGLVFENWHHSREIISLIGVEVDQDYGDHYRTDVNATFGLLARVSGNIYAGARLGVVTNNPGDPVAYGALAIRLLLPIVPKPGFFGALFSEADLGEGGAGEKYAAIRLGLKIF